MESNKKFKVVEENRTNCFKALLSWSIPRAGHLARYNLATLDNGDIIEVGEIENSLEVGQRIIIYAVKPNKGENK